LRPGRVQLIHEAFGEAMRRPCAGVVPSDAAVQSGRQAQRIPIGNFPRDIVIV